MWVPLGRAAGHSDAVSVVATEDIPWVPVVPLGAAGREGPPDGHNWVVGRLNPSLCLPRTELQPEGPRPPGSGVWLLSSGQPGCCPGLVGVGVRKRERAGSPGLP